MVGERLLVFKFFCGSNRTAVKLKTRGQRLSSRSLHSSRHLLRPRSAISRRGLRTVVSTDVCTDVFRGTTSSIITRVEIVVPFRLAYISIQQVSRLQLCFAADIWNPLFVRHLHSIVMDDQRNSRVITRPFSIQLGRSPGGQALLIVFRTIVEQSSRRAIELVPQDRNQGECTTRDRDVSANIPYQHEMVSPVLSLF